MNLEEFVSLGWRDHATDAEGVFRRLPAGVDLVREPGHLTALAALVVHVSGEHLGRWTEGVEILESLERLPVFDAASREGKFVVRSKAVLHRCAGNHDEEARFFAASRTGDGAAEASDRIRVLAVTSAAFLGQKRLAESRRDFEEALTLASYGPTSEDPAVRALAVTGNNIACELETRPHLTDDERSLMLRAAHAGRDFWLIGGGWMEAERADYRLAMSYIKAGDPATALTHARRCFAIIEENGSDPGEAFFAHEALARAQLAGGDAQASRHERDKMSTLLPGVADESFRSFCAQELAKLEAMLKLTSGAPPPVH